jgi:hypothetical protein
VAFGTADAITAWGLWLRRVGGDVSAAATSALRAEVSKRKGGGKGEADVLVEISASIAAAVDALAGG